MDIAKIFFSGAVTANLGVVRTVTRRLQSDHGEVSIEGLESLLLVDGIAHNESVLGTSLSVAVAIGFLHSDGDLGGRKTLISLSQNAEGSTDPNALATAFLATLAQHTVAQIEIGEDIPDLAFALAWILRGDPRRPFSSWSASGPNDPELAVRASGLEELIQNSAQWNAARRWAFSLGCAEPIPTSRTTLVVPDPSRCIDAILDDLPDRMNAKDFVAHLEAFVPFLSGGQIGLALAEQYPNVPVRTTDLGLAESHALFHLGTMDRLVLREAADADPESLVSLAELGPRQLKVFREARILSNG